MDFKAFSKVFGNFIDKSFNDAFSHYSDNFTKVSIQEQETYPVVVVLESGRISPRKLEEDEMGFQIRGVAFSDKDPRKMIKELGKSYAQKIMNEEIETVPVGILLATEVVMRQEVGLPDKEKAKPLQDKKGNPINGATEAYMVTGMTCAGQVKGKVYSIIKDEQGKILDMVHNQEMTDKMDSEDGSLEANVLIAFYEELREEMERLGVREKYEITDERLKDLKEQLNND